MQYFAGTYLLQINEYKGFTSKIPPGGEGGYPQSRRKGDDTEQQKPSPKRGLLNETVIELSW
jgi:hypothetical protein